MDGYHQRPVPASTVAEDAHLNEPTVAKILKLLAGAGIVSSIRGAKGGYILALSLKEINVKQVINALDGPIALTSCVTTSKTHCELSEKCSMHGRWNHVNIAIKRALESVTIADMLQQDRKVL
jgi:Rrf2 family protein